jgi:hypothetical protein
LLREFRGDGHVAALVANEIDGCEANVLIAADYVMPAAMQRANRGWSEEEWASAEDRLLARGLLDAHGLTDSGRRLRATIEDSTDRLSLAPYAKLGAPACAELEGHLLAINRGLGGAVPFPNPMGLTPAADL